MTDIERLVESLPNTEVLGHSVENVEVFETHLSIVLLAGEFAYKLKKPVDLGFVDFTTLEKRLYFCREELRLNRRLAPELYLDVVAICGSIERPRIDRNGAAIEYAVKMRRFESALRFDRLRETGRLESRHLDDLCERVVEFHSRADTAADETEYGTPDCLMEPIRANFRGIDEKCSDAAVLELNEHLHEVAESEGTRLKEVFLQRKQRGRIRECHGDMHLANIALVNGRALIFDCLEFNPKLRWIDVLSEVAFTLMDLEFTGRADLSNRLLDRYLAGTGDYEGLAVLRFYQTYRAMVRAKVAAIRAVQDSRDSHASAECIEYLWLAERYSETSERPAMILTFGLSGSGKSTVAARLVEHLGALRVRSDVERKRLAAPGVDLYDTKMTERTYARLLEIASTCMSCGFSVIVDATFLRAEHRRSFLERARHMGLPGLILEVSASSATLAERITERSAAGGDPSDADLDVLVRQLGTVEPLSKLERRYAVDVDTDSRVDYTELARKVRARADDGR